MGRVRAGRTIRMVGVMVVVLALAATACGKSGGPSGGGATTGGGPTTTAGATTAGGKGKATIEVANVSGLGMVLVDSRGFTLYHLEGETSSNIMCTGGCAKAWPPLEASGTPKAGAGALGTVGTLKRPDGITQVTYDGVPLYRYGADSKPGQSNGQGVAGVWFAVTREGQSAKGSAGGGASPTEASPTASSYYR